MNLSVRWTSPTRVTRSVVLYVLLAAAGLIVTIPFLWMLGVTFMDPPQVWVYPPKWIPNPWVFTNFAAAWNAVPMGQYFINTTIVAIGVIVERLLFSTLAAYAFARLEFPGRDLIFMLFLATVMIPEQVNLIPLYLIVRKLDWLNTYQGMILPSLANAFTIFWLRQFFKGIPVDLEDAARIDGSSRLGILFRIVLPLSVPALAVMCLFSFNEAWNMFLWPLIMTDKPLMRTIEVGLAFFQNQYGGRTGGSEVTWLMAGNTIAIIPAIVFFLIVQRQMIQGMTFTGLKG